MYPVQPPNGIRRKVNRCCGLPIAVDVLAEVIDQTFDPFRIRRLMFNIVYSHRTVSKHT
jgi:hypothetical protein